MNIGDQVAPATTPAKHAIVDGIRVRFDDGTEQIYTAAGDLIAWTPPITELYASVEGSDSTGDGSADRPYRSVVKLINLLPAHGRGLLYEGVYSEGPVVVLNRPGITIASVDPAAKATVRGRVWVQKTAPLSTWDHIDVDGSGRPAGEGQGTFMVNAVSFHAIQSLVRNGRTHIGWNLGGTTYGRADNFLLEHCSAEDCGNDPIHEHGFYIEHATGGTILGGHSNRNSARGYSLYPDAQFCIINGVEATGNGAQGVLFAGGDEDNFGPQGSCDNTVIGSSIHGNGGPDIDTWNGSSAPVARNRVQGTYAPRLGDKTGFTVASPLSAPPVLT